MRKFNQFSILMVILFAWSCNKDENTGLTLEKVNGFVQKGPYLNGTTISIYELTDDMVQTGKIYTSQILDNKGSFELRDISLISEYALLMANGFYFNEVKNESSSAQLTLFALSNLADKSTLNVNVLSHLEKSRVEFLIAGGSSYADAKRQAQSEILKIFEIQKSDIIESEGLDISQSGEDNAILLAISVILQGYLSVGELSELLANISTDIREDGILNSNSLGEILINNANILRTSEIRNNLETRYETLGLDIIMPEFEKYVQQFKDSTKFIPSNNIAYPINYGSRLNVLADSSFIVTSGKYYSIAAWLPVGNTIKIIIKPTNTINWGAAGFFVYDATGCTVENNMPNNIIIRATGNDHTMNMPVMFGEGGPVDPTSIDFLIYENDSEEYTRLKTVRTY